MNIGEQKLEKIFEKNNSKLKKELKKELLFEVDKKFKINNLILENRMKVIFTQGFEELIAPHFDRLYKQHDKFFKYCEERDDSFAVVDRQQKAEIERNDSQDKRLDIVENKLAIK